MHTAPIAIGGALDPYNPTWAPWPVHAWPDAGSHQCEQMQAHATFIQTANQASIVSIQVRASAATLARNKRAQSLTAAQLARASTLQAQMATDGC
jgi:hypothetical protein